MAAPSKPKHVIYHSKSIDNIDSLWWGLMLELGWDRGYQDLAVHWHVSPDWPVVAPSPAPSSDSSSTSSAAAAAAAGAAAASSPPPTPVGLCVPFIYDNGTGWLGFFILQAAHRGHGWGAALFQATLDVFAARGPRFVGLDAVPAQKATYERRGFREVSKIKVMVRPAGLPIGAGARRVRGEGIDVLAAGPDDGFDQGRLVAYEEGVTGFRRSRLWSKEGLWKRSSSDVAGFVAVKRGSGAGEVVGLAVVRDCEKGHRVGPLYAAGGEVAEALLAEVLSWTAERRAPGDTIGAEVNMGNAAAVKLFEDFGWADAGVDYSRMWIDGKATPEQTPGGAFFTHCWAEFDAGQG